jgi:hypothetical protein
MATKYFVAIDADSTEIKEGLRKTVVYLNILSCGRGVINNNYLSCIFVQ